MKIFYTSVLTLALISHSIECSSHSGRDPHSDSNRVSSSSGKKHTTERTPTEEPPHRVRSRSPTSSSSSVQILGCSLEQLGYMRLIPHTNQDFRFEFRRFIFPTDRSLLLRTDGKKFMSVPDGEHIVLSTSNGEIFAILDYSGFFRGIHRRKYLYPRVKINMMSGAIEDLTPDERRDCPVGRNCPIFPKRFMRAFAATDSLNSEWHPDSGNNRGSPSSARQQSPDRSPTHGDPPVRARSIYPPGRLPYGRVLGYTMEELGYVRLIPIRNKRQRLEFRRYIFPSNEHIRMTIENMSYSIEMNREYIVVSTSNGDVFAILDYGGTLRGIYSRRRTRTRVKIDMTSGAIDDMTPDEIRDCEVGRNYPVFPTRFIEGHSNQNSLQFRYDSTGRHNSDDSPVRPNSLYLTPSQEHPVDTSSSSPPGRPPSHEVLGIPLARLGYIRLIPEMNPHRQFEFRRYVSPLHKPLYLLSGYNKYVPIPIREHIVLSTSSGDVFAILEYTGILRGIYEVIQEYSPGFSRIKINMLSGEVHKMTGIEIQECHVGTTYPIFPRWFQKIVSDEDSLQHVYH